MVCTVTYKKSNCSQLNRGSVERGQLGCNLPTHDRRYLIVDHTTNGGWWEQPSMNDESNPELALALSSTLLPTSEGWKAELA